MKEATLISKSSSSGKTKYFYVVYPCGAEIKASSKKSALSTITLYNEKNHDYLEFSNEKTREQFGENAESEQHSIGIGESGLDWVSDECPSAEESLRVRIESDNKRIESSKIASQKLNDASQKLNDQFTRVEQQFTRVEQAFSAYDESVGGFVQTALTTIAHQSEKIEGLRNSSSDRGNGNCRRMDAETIDIESETIDF